MWSTFKWMKMIWNEIKWASLSCGKYLQTRQLNVKSTGQTKIYRNIQTQQLHLTPGLMMNGAQLIKITNFSEYIFLDWVIFFYVYKNPTNRLFERASYSLLRNLRDSTNMWCGVRSTSLVIERYSMNRTIIFSMESGFSINSHFAFNALPLV